MTAQDDIDRKVTRAKEHRDYLVRRFALYAKRRPRHRLETTVEAGGLQHVVRIYNVPPIPPEWGVILSEFFHNLRSALDNLMWQLVLANGKTPGRRTAFPIQHERKDRDFKTMTAGASDGAVEVIANLQPYLAAGKVSHHPLFLVHELNRLDKHRTLTVVTAAPRDGEWYIPPDAVGTVVRSTLQPLHDGAEVYRFILKEPRPHMDWQVKVSTIQTFIMETETTPYLNFPEDLALLHGAVVRVVDLFRSETFH